MSGGRRGRETQVDQHDSPVDKDARGCRLRDRALAPGRSAVSFPAGRDSQAGAVPVSGCRALDLCAKALVHSRGRRIHGSKRTPEVSPGQDADRPADGGRRVRRRRAGDHPRVPRPLRSARRPARRLRRLARRQQRVLHQGGRQAVRTGSARPFASRPMACPRGSRRSSSSGSGTTFWSSRGLRAGRST